MLSTIPRSTHLLFLITVQAFQISLASATTIVLVRTPEEVTIASDSKRISHNPPGSFLACKIHRAGKALIAVVGISKINGDVKFDLADFAKQIVSTSSSLSEAVIEFESRVNAPLVKVTETLSGEDPTFLQTREKHWMYQIAFVGFENGQPTRIQIQFMPQLVNNKIQIKSEKHSCPPNCLDPVDVFLMGEFQNIKTKLSEDTRLFKQNIAEDLKQLIALEITANPSKVGAPIAIVRLNQTGIEWVQDELHCAKE